MLTFSAPKAFHVSISFEVSSISFEVSSLSIANLFSNLSECFPFSMSNDLIILLPAQSFGEVQVRERERETERERDRDRERERETERSFSFSRCCRKRDKTQQEVADARRKHQ